MENNNKIINEDWQVLLKILPVNWKILAKETQAFARKLKSFKDEETILRMLFLHFGNGYSLRETVTRAKIAGIADVTDVALLKRLKCAEHWLKSLCMSLLRERGISFESISDHDICLRLVDGTIVKEPGKTGSQWRIHYSLKLPDLQCDYFKLTETKGAMTGESFKQYPVKEKDCVVGDRAYSTLQGIEYLNQKGAYSLVRVNSSTLNFYTINLDEFNLLKQISKLEQDYQAEEWEVNLKNSENKWLNGRLCVIRKSEVSADIAIKKLKRDASKRQQKLKAETLEFAKYIILFTTLPVEKFNLSMVLEWYRLRWQIELAIKRLKSLVYLGHLPKYDEQSSRAWLYGKLLVGLITEKLMSYAGSISPSGYYL